MKYVSARYIEEKLYPIERLCEIVHEAEKNDISDEIRYPEEIALAFAMIAKEMGVKIPEV